MLMQLITKRSCKNVGSEMKIWAWGALAVTVEVPSLIHPGDQGYHITMTKEDLLTLLSKIEARENEIKGMRFENSI